MRKTGTSIVGRIIFAHFLALAASAVVVSAAAYFLLTSTVNDYEQRILRDHAIAVAQYLTFQNGHWTLSLPPELQAVYTRGYGGYALAVSDENGRLLYSSVPHGGELLGKMPVDEGLILQRVHGMDYYGFNYPAHANGHLAWIGVAQSYASPDVIIDDVVARFLRRIALIMLPFFGFLLFLDTLLIRRVLRPVRQASEVAASISPARPAERLPAAQLPQEISPLAKAVNQALDRLEAALSTQREFTADAAHELRTPLAILRTRVDTTVEPAVARELQADIDAVVRILDQLLELAELEGSVNTATGGADLNDLCAEVVALMAPLAIAEGKGLELAASEKRAVCPCSPDMISRAVRNLVENALRFSPLGGTVHVAVISPATIRVEDQGPGVRPEDREMIFRRFWRRNRQSKDHAGLGLAIVAKVAQIHGGSITVQENAGGGAIFELTLAH
jgi:signal transduction histidine kinase